MISVECSVHERPCTAVQRAVRVLSPADARRGATSVGAGWRHAVPMYAVPAAERRVHVPASAQEHNCAPHMLARSISSLFPHHPFRPKCFANRADGVSEAFEEIATGFWFQRFQRRNNVFEYQEFLEIALIIRKFLEERKFINFYFLGHRTPVHLTSCTHAFTWE